MTHTHVLCPLIRTMDADEKLCMCAVMFISGLIMVTRNR